MEHSGGLVEVFLVVALAATDGELAKTWLRRWCLLRCAEFRKESFFKRTRLDFGVLARNAKTHFTTGCHKRSTVAMREINQFCCVLPWYCNRTIIELEVFV